MEWYLSVLRNNYANFNGRARRKEYWMFFLFNMLFAFAATLIDFVLGIYPLLYAVYLLAVLIPSFAVFVRRLHDTGKSGWWVFIGLIPIIGAIWLLVLMFTDGDPSDNGYGPSPKAV